MSDFFNQKQVDGWFVSSPPQGYESFKTALQNEFPTTRDGTIAAAILACRKTISSSQGMDKLKSCVRAKLKMM